MVYVFWNKFLNVNLKISCNWINCDCFVLLVGYGLVFFYSLFYLVGYDLLIDDLK